MTRRPVLLIQGQDRTRREHILGDDRTTIGRSASADLSFPEDNGLSRLHAAFERKNGAYVVRDLNSKNGTCVNGSRIEGDRALKHKDEITCGHLKIVFATEPISDIIFVDETTDAMDNASIYTTLGGVLEAAKSEAGSPLKALITAGNELASERPLTELFPLILRLAMDAVGARRGLIMTVQGSELVERASRGEQFRISTAVRDRVMEQKLSVLVRDTSLDAVLKSRESIVIDNVRTLMAAPLQVRDEVQGILYVDQPRVQREFTRDDLNLLTVMANVAAIRIEHSRLAEEEQARKLMQYELTQAEEIQRNALPRRAPTVRGLDLAGRNQASRTISGDYYDFFTDNEGNVAVVVADVSGKGLSAALMVMALQARVQPLFETLPRGPGELASAIERLNRLTTANCPPARFITLFACVANGATGRVDWCSAGHNPPLILRHDGSREILREGDPVLGIFSDMPYEQRTAELRPGDLLAIYSDGISEACSPEGEEFQLERLADALRENRLRPAGEIADAVLKRVRSWTNDAPAADDITLVVARMTE